MSPASIIKPFKPNSRPFPTLFFSHGGPTFMYENDSFGNEGAHKIVKQLGTIIKQEWKPDYIVVVLAHYQSSGPKSIEIAAPSLSPTSNNENPLIYDFYGFPKHMYQEEFHSNFDYNVANQVKQELERGGFNSQLVKRGIDHGVWVPFKVAFSNYNTQSESKPPLVPELDLPDTSLIQVSLTGSETDFDLHFKLGQILSKFRENLIWDESRQKYLTGLVVCSGMSVHNLRDLGISLRNPTQAMPYVGPFQKLLKTTLVNDDKLLSNLKSLQTTHKKLLYQAHPTLEHFLPLVVASGIVSQTPDEKIKELYNADSLSLGWGIYQFGKNY